MTVMAGLSRSKNGVASLAYVPAIPIMWHSVANLSGITGSRRHRAALRADPVAAAR
jgi:hypothetical protein